MRTCSYSLKLEPIQEVYTYKIESVRKQLLNSIAFIFEIIAKTPEEIDTHSIQLKGNVEKNLITASGEDSCLHFDFHYTDGHDRYTEAMLAQHWIETVLSLYGDSMPGYFRDRGYTLITEIPSYETRQADRQMIFLTLGEQTVGVSRADGPLSERLSTHLPKLGKALAKKIEKKVRENDCGCCLCKKLKTNRVNFVEDYRSSFEADAQPYPYSESLTKALESPLEVRTLTLTNQFLDAIPEEIGRFTNLHKLGLINNQIQTLPESLNRLSDLTDLELQHNHLTALSPALSNLKSLQCLHAGHNPIEAIPEGLALPNVVTLSLRETDLKKLPASFRDWKELWNLDLTNTRLESLPPEIVELPKLRHLKVSHVQNADGSLEQIAFDQLGDLTELTLKECNLKSFPASILHCAKLEYLNLSDNDIGSLPQDIGNLKNLSRLYLNNCGLTYLPASIGKLIELTMLSLIGNDFESLPVELCELPNLKYLYVSHQTFRFLQGMTVPESLKVVLSS
jgi:hypothetical protein